MFDMKELSIAIKKSLDPNYKSPEEEALERLSSSVPDAVEILKQYFERKIKGE